MKGNSKRISGKSFTSYRVQNKDIGAASPDITNRGNIMSAKQATKIKAMTHGLTYDVAHPQGSPILQGQKCSLSCIEVFNCKFCSKLQCLGKVR